MLGIFIVSTMAKGDRVILLHAFHKKSQKTSQKEIEMLSRGGDAIFKDTTISNG